MRDLASHEHCVVPTVWRPMSTLPAVAVVRALVYAPTRGVRQTHFVRRSESGHVVGSLMTRGEDVDLAHFTHWAAQPHPMVVASSRTDGPGTFAAVFVAVGMVACAAWSAIAPGSLGAFVGGMAASAVTALVAGYAARARA